MNDLDRGIEQNCIVILNTNIKTHTFDSAQIHQYVQISRIYASADTITICLYLKKLTLKIFFCLDDM